MDKSKTINQVHEEVRQALQIVGDRWSGLILICLLEEPMRFIDIQRSAGGVNSRTLTQKLRALEAAGLIERQTYKEYPPRTVYRVTKKARDLKEAISGLKHWAKKYCALN
jgi:DNA-binding HxlR family transcriptional regulator